MEQNLTRSDIRFIVACGVTFIVALIIGTHFFYQAFPEATIDFKITREDARDRADDFLQHRGLDIEGYRHSAIFTFDNMSKTFLERELGLEEAMAVIGNPVRLWRWSNRWVKELQKEEFRVEYTTAGELVGFLHAVEEDREGATLEQREARYLAEQFLSHTMAREMANLEFVEAETTKRPNRSDHSFTWKLIDFEISEATYRVRVGIQGDLVSSYSEYLKIPEAWHREYVELRSRNQTAGLVASAFMAFTILAMIVILVTSIRGQDVRWKTVAIFGSIAFTLTFLSQLNSLPLTEYNFDTTETFGSFLTGQLLFGLLGALASGIFIATLTAAAEPVYRRAFANHISLTEQFLPDGIRTKRFLIGTIIGLTLTPLIVAYQTVFYVVADKLGAWSPANIPYSDMVNTHIPWVVVLLVGFMPAVSEEFMSRAFSIPFLQRFIRQRWLVILIPALIWGFAHSGYPQQPFYIRGVEVGLIGILLGWVMIRWGILPVLVWHYTIDAFYTALVLLRSSNDYFVISAAVSAGLMLLPLLAAVLLYLRFHFFVDATSLLNAEDSPALATSKEKPPGDLSPEALLSETAYGEVSYTPLTTRRILVAGAIILVPCATFLLDVEEPFDFVDIDSTPGAAELIAADHLTTIGIDADTFRSVVTPRIGVDGRALKYRMERRGLVGIDTLYRAGELHPARWMVRYFRPLEKEEYHVQLDMADGAVLGVGHLIEEVAPGADLNEDEALAIAVSHLRASGIDPETLDLKEASSEKLEARRDHDFVWQAGEGDDRNLDESYFRISAHVSGDEVTSLKRFVKLPEEWLREREESTTVRAALKWLKIAVIVAICLHLLWLLIRQVRRGEIIWRPLLVLGGVGGIIALSGMVNGLPTAYAGYQTEMQEGLFITSLVVQHAVGLVFIALMLTAAVALATTLYPDCLKKLRLQRAAYFKDAVWIAFLAWIADISSRRFIQLVSEPFAEYGNPPGVTSVAGLGSFLPAWDGISSSLAAAFFYPLMTGVAIYYALRVLKWPSIVIAVIIAFGLVSATADAHSSGEFYLQFARFLITTGVKAAVIIFLLRDNILAYVLFGFWSASLEPSYDMLSQSSSLYQIHGGIWMGLSVVVIAGLWLHSRLHPSTENR